MSPRPEGQGAGAERLTHRDCPDPLGAENTDRIEIIHAQRELYYSTIFSIGRTGHTAVIL